VIISITLPIFTFVSNPFNILKLNLNSFFKKLSYSQKIGEVFLVLGMLSFGFIFLYLSRFIFNLNGVPIFESMAVIWIVVILTQMHYFVTIKDIQLFGFRLGTTLMLSVFLYSLYFGTYYGYYYYKGNHKVYQLQARVTQVLKEGRGYTMHCRGKDFKKSMRIDGALHTQMLKCGVENYCVSFKVFEGDNKVIYWETYQIKPCE
jgi:hypothetical protein